MIAVIEYCQFEDVPKDQSSTYLTLEKFYGEAFANQFTYEVEVDLSESARVDRVIPYYT